MFHNEAVWRQFVDMGLDVNVFTAAGYGQAGWGEILLIVGVVFVGIYAWWVDDE